MTETMRAWISGERGAAGLVLSMSVRPRPGPGEVLVQVDVAALNFSDQLMIDDRYQVRPPRPFVPGQEIAGRVIEVGSECSLTVGDRIAAKVHWGGFAEQALVRETMAIPLPTDLPIESGAALPVVYTTAMVALMESTSLRAGETILVLAAAGGVGLAAVEIATAFGARAFAAAGGAEKGALACRNGAVAAFDYREPTWADAVKTATDGRGVDVVFDPVGGDESVAALRVLARRGRFLIVGFASGKIPQIPANRLLLKQASAIGVYWDHETDGAMLQRVNDRLADLLRTGAIRPYIGASYAFDALPQALADLAGRRTTGKVLLRVGDAS